MTNAGGSIGGCRKQRQRWPERVPAAIGAALALIAAGRIPEVIGVFPDGGGGGVLGRSRGLDSHDGRTRLEHFLTRTLPAWADRTMRTRADAAHRALIGQSAGGTGALNVLLRDPGIDGAAASHRGDDLLTPDRSSAPLFGPEPGASVLRAAYSPLLAVVAHADRLHGMTL